MTATWEPSRLGDSMTLRLARLLTLTVSREVQSRDNPSPTPYAATVFGGRLTRRFATTAAAKTAAIAFAKQQLGEALAALPDTEARQEAIQHDRVR